MDEDTDDERAVELDSITAIYPEIILDPDSKFKASLTLPVSPESPIKVIFGQTSDENHVTALPSPPPSVGPSDLEHRNDDNAEKPVSGIVPFDHEAYYLSHLPPLHLEIELPEGYPSTKPPIFSLYTSPSWLPDILIKKLLKEGKDLWEGCGRDLVVYSYIDHLHNAAEEAFGINRHSRSFMVLPQQLKIGLLDFDIKAKRQRFEQKTFQCSVCLEPKKGSICHQLQLCSHVFCVPCLQGFYSSCIKEGDVSNVKCLAPDCGKDPTPLSANKDVVNTQNSKKNKKQDRTLNPSELLQIPIDREAVQRYARLKRKTKLESDKTTIYCPRQWCQGAARSKKHPKPTDLLNDSPELSEDEDDNTPFDPLGSEDQLPPMAERVAICEDCNYAFCSVCRKGWHGEINRCFPRRAIELTEEEKASEKYMESYTSQCPTCNARCQKAMGCNHMICFKCGTHFCYLCSSWLFSTNPYQHFNTPGTPCYMKLWEMEGGDGVRVQQQLNMHDILDELDQIDDEDDIRQRQVPPPPAPVPPRPVPLADAGRQPPRQHRENAQARENGAINGGPAAQRHPENARPDPNDGGHGHHLEGQIRGLQRFLYLVQHDQEDEWDSDELDDDF